MAKEKRTKSQKIIFAIVFCIVLIYCICLLYPFYFLLQLATKQNAVEFSAHFISNKLGTWSNKINLYNFADALYSLEVNGFSFIELVFNSLWFSVGSMVVSLFFISSTAYVVSKYKFKGQHFIYNLNLLIMIIPIYGALPSAIRLYTDLGIMNSPLILITATNAFGSSFLIMYAFYKAISWEYAEAAFIDGANHYQVYFKVMLPMVLPPMTVLFITGFISHWNKYMNISIFMAKLPTLSYALYVYESNMRYLANQPVYFAGVFIAIIPCIILFLVFQNTLMQTVHLGGVKG